MLTSYFFRCENYFTEEEADDEDESRVCVMSLSCCDWTGEDAAAAGDRAIHDRDVDWLRQSDGDPPITSLIIGGCFGPERCLQV